MKPKEKSTEKVIRDRLSSLFSDEKLKLVVLFGSTATGNNHKKSDIDLGFLFDKRVDILELTNTVIRLVKTDNVDVVDLRYASPLLKFSAVKKGKLIYEKEQGMFNEFASLAFRMYADSKKLRDAQIESIKNFLNERGGL